MFDYWYGKKTSQQFTTNTLSDKLITPDHQNEVIKYQAKYCKMCKQLYRNLSTVFAEIEKEANTYSSNGKTENVSNHPLLQVVK